MKTKVYQYPKCSTCRKALKWLDARQVVYEAIDIVATPPSQAELRRALERGFSLKNLFNTSGQSYRDGKWSEKIAHVTEAQALSALVADGKLIKRPFVVTDGAVLVGFDEGAYQKVFPAR